jgi:Recombinational DNA repair ATPase (RecF pathway)
LADAVGGWLAVSFLPDDVSLAAGTAADRRGYLDRLLSLADRGTCGACRATVARSRNGTARCVRAAGR